MKNIPYLQYAIGLMYLFLGFYVVSSKTYGTLGLKPIYGYALGTLFAIYGIFRIFRAYKNSNDE